MALPQCSKCQSEYTYEDGDLLICPECGYEWKEGKQLRKLWSSRMRMAICWLMATQLR